MNELIRSPHKFRVKLLLDSNVLVMAKMEEHLAALEEVLRRMKEAGFQLKREKCMCLPGYLGCVLGYQIDEHGSHLVAEKLQALQEGPRPKSSSPI